MSLAKVWEIPQLKAGRSYFFLKEIKSFILGVIEDPNFLTQSEGKSGLHVLGEDEETIFHRPEN